MTDNKPPEWYIDLTIPLLDADYALAGIANDSTIHSDSLDGSLSIKFDGELPQESIDGEYLKVPGLEDPLTEEIKFDVPNSADILEDLNYTEPIPPFTLDFEENEIPGIVWNAVMDSIEDQIKNDFSITLVEDFDLGGAFGGSLDFIDPKGLIVAGDSASNHFRSSITVEDFPDGTGVKEFSIGIESDLSPDRYLGKQHKRTEILVNDEEYADSSSFVGDTISTGSIAIEFSLVFLKVSPDAIVTITEGDTPKIVLELKMVLSNPDTALVGVADHKFPTEFEPPSFSGMSSGNDDPCSIGALLGGKFESKTLDNDLPNVNRFNFSDISSTLPFPIDFTIDFKNFVPPTDNEPPVKIEEILVDGDEPVVKEIKIYGYNFLNVTNPGDPLEELEVDITVKTVPGTYKFPIDGSKDEWEFTFGIGMGEMWFESLTANIDCPFPSQTQEIGNIPQGVTGMSFGEVILKITMFNQIKLPITLKLDLLGISSVGDTVKMDVLVDLAKPADDSVSDTAKTVIKLSSIGTEVEKFESTNEGTVPETIPAVKEEGSNTIVDLLAINPKDFLVNATATVKGEGIIEADKSIWGIYELEAPFIVRIDPMTFIPNNSTVIDEWAHDTRTKLRNFVKGAFITSRVINGLPIGGNLSVLFSNKEFFPLDRSPETLAAMANSLDWDSLYVVSNCESLMKPDSDIIFSSVIYNTSDCMDGTAYLVRGFSGESDLVVSYVDTMFTIELPRPKSYYAKTSPIGLPMSVMTPGDTTITTGLDSSKMFLLTDLGKHFVRPRTHFSGTLDQAQQLVQFSMKDTISIKAFMVFQLQMLDGLLAESEDEYIITYPNGGETLYTGEEVTFKWRSLPDTSINNTDIHVYIDPTGENPEDAKDWVEVSDDPKDDGKPITNTGEFTHIFKTGEVYEKIWLMVCGPNKVGCDKSLSTFEVKEPSPLSRSKLISKNKRRLSSLRGNKY